jgi:transposase InsO family protein
VLDDAARYILARKLRSAMAASDVTGAPEPALTASGCTKARVRPRR